jgi:SAM-dependent methyltransferase
MRAAGKDDVRFVDRRVSRGGSMSDTTMTPEMSALKSRLKTTWESGDYGVFAKPMEKGAIEFFDRLDIAPGTRLLDVACGAGQLTIPAARRGIDVTALDLAANLVEQARARAAAEGLHVRVDQGDAEQLPYPEASFDVVLSFIGAMFAPRPELVARELTRVCGPGGRVIMGNWTPAGFVGQMFKVIGRHVPPPANFPSPLLWGDEAVCRDRLSPFTSTVQITRRMFPFEYSFPPEQVVDFFISYYGPTNRAAAALGDEGKSALRNDLIALWGGANTATDGTTRVDGEYLEVVATK